MFAQQQVQALAARRMGVGMAQRDTNGGRLHLDAVARDLLASAGIMAADVARDWPREVDDNGAFVTLGQRLDMLVLPAPKGQIGLLRAHEMPLPEPHQIADALGITRAEARLVRVLAQGMLDTGLLNRNTVGNVDDVIAQRAYFQFYMHRTGHWLGLDVHDCGSYVEPSEVGSIHERRDPLSGETIKDRPSRILRQGMVLTLEPGLYVRPAPGVPEAFWNIGIRIEDDALVTATGCELITRGVPVAADEIEALMRA
jgi:Xaa-Pro aminopeptidase